MNDQTDSHKARPLNPHEDGPPNSHEDDPPNYHEAGPPSNPPVNEKEFPPDYYSSANPEHGWDFIVCNSGFLNGLNVFVSSEAVGKYKSFKDNSNVELSSHINDLQAQGLGVPLFHCETHSFSMNKFLTITRYHTNNAALKGFNRKTDFTPFCKITKHHHSSYYTYILTFTPNPNDPNENFKVWMFSHRSLPIREYEYKGVRYRWIHSKKYVSYLESYRACRLDPNQPAMLDNWTGGDTLNSQSNSLVGNKFSQLVKPSSRKPKEEYYSENEVGKYDELKKRSLFGRLQESTRILLPDITNTCNSDVNYDSIHSVHLDVLVHLCMGLIIKRHEDIQEDNRAAAAAAAS